MFLDQRTLYIYGLVLYRVKLLIQPLYHVRPAVAFLTCRFPGCARTRSSFVSPANRRVMLHHQNLQLGGFVGYPPYPSSSDSMESLPREEAGAAEGFGDQTTPADSEFFVGDLDLEQLDPWRRNVPSPRPRITDAITQGTSCSCSILSQLVVGDQW